MDFGTGSEHDSQEDMPGDLPDESSFDFSSDDAAEESMKQFIRENFSDLLGDRVELLDEPNGIAKLKASLQEEINKASKELPENMKRLAKLLK